jgi:hypothetical protein
LLPLRVGFRHGKLTLSKRRRTAPKSISTSCWILLALLFFPCSRTLAAHVLNAYPIELFRNRLRSASTSAGLWKVQLRPPFGGVNKQPCPASRRFPSSRPKLFQTESGFDCFRQSGIRSPFYVSRRFISSNCDHCESVILTNIPTLTSERSNSHSV